MIRFALLVLLALAAVVAAVDLARPPGVADRGKALDRAILGHRPRLAPHLEMRADPGDPDYTPPAGCRCLPGDPRCVQAGH